jgi:hypothetical protein
MLVAPLITLVVGAVWFAPMVVRHGVGVLVAGAGSRMIDLPDNAIALLAQSLNPPNLAFTIGAVGIVIAWEHQRWDLLAWFMVSAFGAAVVDRWAVIPLAVLAGLAVDAAIDELPRLRAFALVTVSVIVAVLGVALAEGPVAVSTDERAVMDWARNNTNADATFALIGYSFDSGTIDWFPPISQRRNASTWQGTEWKADGYTRAEAEAVLACRELNCVPDVDYVVLRDGCCEELAAMLRVVRPGVFEEPPH